MKNNKGKRFNKEFAAMVLITATYQTDKVACEKFSVSQRTLFNYRQKLSDDAEFASYFHTKNQEYVKGFVDELFLAVRSGANYIRETTTNPPAEAKLNPEFLHAVAGAVKICAEVAITYQYIEKKLKLLSKDAGTTEPDRTQSGIFRQDTDAPENELPN